MTPQERQRVAELFERLARLENSPREREAEELIMEGLRYAPNSPYAMVQTILVQEEALERANARVQELEMQGGAEPAQAGGGFLDSLRGAFGGNAGTPRRVSVPSAGGRHGHAAWRPRIAAEGAAQAVEEATARLGGLCAALHFQFLDAGVGTLQRLFLHENGLHHGVGRIRRVAQPFHDELFRLALARGILQPGKPFEQFGNALPFLRGHRMSSLTMPQDVGRRGRL